MRIRQPVRKQVTNRPRSQCKCRAMSTKHYYYTSAIGHEVKSLYVFISIKTKNVSI